MRKSARIRKKMMKLLAIPCKMCYNILYYGSVWISNENGGDDRLNRFLRRLAAMLTACIFGALTLTGIFPHEQPGVRAAAEIHGIDISKYQEAIDWVTVAQNDVKFAILRCCKVIRAYDDWEYDASFEENYLAAKAAGLAVGCYMFTDAATVSEFEEDVSYMLGFLKDKSFDFPVFLDLESASRQEHLPPSVFMPALLSGLEQIEDAGHTAGVYSSSAFYSECIDRKQLQEAGYAIWEANYFNSVNGLSSPAGHDLSAEATIWQYSGNGRCPGIKTTVDRNICYTYQYFNHAAVITNSMLPTGTLPSGSNFTVGGTVSSESVIRSLTGSIYDLANPHEPVQTVTVYPHARDYKLTGFFTKKLIFSTLDDGEYKLRITAVDASNTEIEVTESLFNVGSGNPEAEVTSPPESEPETVIGTESTAAAQMTSGIRQTAPDGSGKGKASIGLRFTNWFYAHWGMRGFCAKATKIGIKLDLTRTPLFRIFSGWSCEIETAYLAARVRLHLVQA